MYADRLMYLPLRLRLMIDKLGISDPTKLPSATEFGRFAYWHIKSTKVMIVGLNPSNESPDNSAFHPDTKSGRTIRNWLKDTQCCVEFENIYGWKDKDHGKPLKSELILPDRIKLAYACGFKIVTCGNVADEILVKYKIKHFAMPHPSGLCRFWNDKEKGDAKIAEMLEWIES